MLFYLCGDQKKASSRVRGYWVTEVLEEQGVKCSLESRHSKVSLLWFLIRIPFHQVVVFQKVYSRWHCLLLRWAKVLKKKTILDLDDAPSRTNHPVTLRNVEFMMRNVSAVTVGSQALFEYASQFSDNVHLIPSSIRLKYYQPVERSSTEGGLSAGALAKEEGQRSEDGGQRTDNAVDKPSTTDQAHLSNLNPNNLKPKPECDVRIVTLGWIGNGKHYRDDLISILKEPLTEVAKVHPIRFKLIGACGQQELYEAFQNIQGLELDFIDQIEWSDPTAVAQALQDIDVGLYPLLPNEFNKYKCGFKALEYMAMKIPVISSDVAENREIIEEGVNGFFAASSEDWKTAFLKLIDDAELRNTMGMSGRTLVEVRYSVRKVVSQFIELINKA